MGRFLSLVITKNRWYKNDFISMSQIKYMMIFPEMENKQGQMLSIRM